MLIPMLTDAMAIVKGQWSPEEMATKSAALDSECISHFGASFFSYFM